MVLLIWGWVHQRIKLRFRPTVWKKRYLVLTTISVHVYKSEKGVMSSLSPDNLPTVHVWSNFRSAKSYTSHSSSSKKAHTFLIEPRDSELYPPLKFKCVTLEEKEKWLDAINEQLKLTSHNTTSTTISKSSAPKYAFERPIISVSVLDKWLDQLQIIDTAILIKQQQQQQKDASPNSSSLGSSSIKVLNHRNDSSSKRISSSSINRRSMQKIDPRF